MRTIQTAGNLVKAFETCKTMQFKDGWNVCTCSINMYIKAWQTIQTNKQFKTWNMILMCKQFRHRETWNLVATCSLETQPGFASQLFALKEIELYSNIKQISRLKMVASSVLLCGTNWPEWDPCLMFVFVVTDIYEIWWDQLTRVGPID